MPPRFSLNTDLTLGVNAPYEILYEVRYFDYVVKVAIFSHV
jgi:hypothetical protein